MTFATAAVIAAATPAERYARVRDGTETGSTAAAVVFGEAAATAAAAAVTACVAAAASAAAAATAIGRFSPRFIKRRYIRAAHSSVKPPTVLPWAATQISSPQVGY